MRVAALTVSLLPVAFATAQSPTFAPPVRLKAGDEFLGHKDPFDQNGKRERLYPSPVWHDLDGDKLADLVVGDLRGYLSVAKRRPGTPATYGPEEKVLGADGKELKLHNW
jgi:hypothetical protein